MNELKMHENASPLEPDAASPGRRKTAILAGLAAFRRSRIFYGAAALLVVGACYATYRVIGTKEPASPRAARRALAGPQPVAVADVARLDVKIVRHGLLGTVTPIANVSVKTQLSGYLVDIGFKEGQLVEKGDFLAQIDPRPYEASKAQYEGQLLRDQGLLDQARDDLRRYQSLKKLDSIARQQADNQNWVVKQYEGAVKADQALVDNQSLNLTYARIVSPIRGRVGLRKIDAGSYVSTGDAIALVAQIDPISVIFGVPEDYIPEIASAQKKRGALEVTVFDRSDTRQIAVGRLQTLDNSIDPTTGMVSGRAEFANADDKLYPNQFVNVHLLVDIHEKALVVPKTAIRSGASGLFVYKVTDQNRVVMQQITPSAGEHYDDFAGYNSGMVEIARGLTEGERVVTDGADRLRDGADVRIVAGGDGAGAPSQEKRRDGPERARERRQQRPPSEAQ
ncbi:efflux RND transporter periplasmic adaptor subunit [Methylosinus sporium]|uniref:efflux RND transporter periplasmic adaptor subunit n=1 Tax=Methylosinus sporium TaxID=428 RepID=UPI00383B1144